MEVWCLSAAWQPRVEGRVPDMQGETLPSRSWAPKSPGAPVTGSAPAASGHGPQHPPRLPDPEIVERGEVDVERDHRPHREVRAEPGEEGRHSLLARLRER